MNTLPTEIISMIYQYDGRDRENQKKLVEEIKYMINWYNVKKETIVSSMTKYYTLLTIDEQQYFMNMKELRFSKFYFSHKYY